MSYYRTCPRCGAHLYPGEVCNCWGKEKTPAGAANTDEGGMEQNLTAVSASHDTRENGGFQA